MENLTILKKQLSEYSKKSFNRGLVSGTGGNLSIRIPGEEKMLITPSGMALDEVAADDSILMDFEGNVIEVKEGFKPSKEAFFHIAVYRSRPDILAIAHLHPPYAVAFSNESQPLPLATISARVILDFVPCVECARPGSQELCLYVEEGVKKYPKSRAYLMKEHGIIAVGATLREAYYISDLVESSAHIAFASMIIKSKG